MPQCQRLKLAGCWPALCPDVLCLLCPDSGLGAAALCLLCPDSGLGAAVLCLLSLWRLFGGFLKQILDQLLQHALP